MYEKDSIKRNISRFCYAYFKKEFVATLKENYIDQGLPVIYWACIDMREPIIGPEWRLLGTGEVFTWISNEHCMLLVGYDDTHYYFNDPYEGHGVISYPKELVENRHKAQYEMAIGVQKKRIN